MTDILLDLTDEIIEMAQRQANKNNRSRRAELAILIAEALAARKEKK